MNNYFIVASIYNPYDPITVTNKNGDTKKFTQEEAQNYIIKNKHHLNPLAMLEIKEK